MKDVFAYRNKIIAFDLDMTLTITEDPDWCERSVNENLERMRHVKPNKRMVNLFNQLAENNTVYIFTARNDITREVTERWLKNNGVNYAYLVMNKSTYDLFIDDRAINALELNEGLE